MITQRIVKRCRLSKYSFMITRCAATFQPSSEERLPARRTDYTTQDVFSSKSTEELLRALFVLKASSIAPFVKYSDKLFLLGRRFTFEPVFHRLMKSTFYGQFAAGVSIIDARTEVNKLSKAGIRSMLCVPIETTKYESPEAARRGYLRNKDIVMETIQGTACVDLNGFAQLKLTALCDKELILKMNKCLVDYELDHQEPDEWNVKLRSKMLIQQKYDEMFFPSLPDDMNHSLRLLFKDLDELVTECQMNDVRLMIDAEQTYLQAALGWLVLVLQAKYNQDKQIVYNTYQCYRKDTLERVKADHQLAEKLGFKIAGKLVRGAYMTEERQLSTEKNYPDPICDSYDATNSNYHAVFDYLLPFILQGDVGVMVATHNEDTVDYVKSLFESHQIDLDNPFICFGQLYGMCDHISWHLGKEGYQVYKSVPYGTIDDTMLYLSRRAHENKSVLGRTAFERFLIKKELGKRLRGDVSID